MSDRKTITIIYEGKKYGVAYFAGSEAAAIEKACLGALHLEATAPLHFVDEQNRTVAICNALPDGIILTYSKQPIPSLTAPKETMPFLDMANIQDILNKEKPTVAFRKIIETYGTMVPIQLPNLLMFACSDADVLQDMLKRPNDFQKMLTRAVQNLRAHSLGDGLFTCKTDEEIWEIAHRIIMPGFSVQAIHQYYNNMLEVADELLVHLEAIPDNEPILITEWMTRMAFETLTSSVFSTKYHTMDQKDLPPFVKAMAASLEDAMNSVHRPLPECAYPVENKKREEADKIMMETVDKIIRERKEKIKKGETVPDDLLQRILTTTDRKTGKQLPDDNIRYQLITLLIAGHETPSDLLSFALYHLMSNPMIEQKLIEEVDQVLGRDYSHRPTYDDIDHLPFTLHVLKEALRLNPPVPFFGLSAMRDTIINEKYAVKKGDGILIVLEALHRNPKYWGEDANRFDPDRFLPEAVKDRHPDAYHPFGGGVRSCIGFQFALKETTMILARLYQRFKLRLHDKNYQLKIIDTLSVHPKDLYIVIEKRQEEKGKFPKKITQDIENSLLAPVGENGPKLLFLFGSNMGCCQDVAQKLAQQAQVKGYRPIVKELDEQIEIPWDTPYVAIITSTYNGLPPDDADQFNKWLINQSGAPLSSIHYTVLGIGNKQWHATFAQFPRFVDARMKELGATCFYPMGTADVDGDSNHDIEEWAKGVWQKLQEALPAAHSNATEKELFAPAYACEITNYAGPEKLKTPHIRLDLQSKEMVMLRNEELLSKHAERSTRHIEIRYPPECSYKTGDHLGVLPENAPETVAAAANLCHLRLDDIVVIKSLQDSPQAEKFPVGIPISVQDLLTAYVDLEGPVSREELRRFAYHCPCPHEKKTLEELSDEKFAKEILEKEQTLIGICQQFQSVNCSLELLLTARPALKPRYYSISSSPLALPNACSITVGVCEYTTRGGRHLKGVCSNYLARVPEGNLIRCFIKDTKSHFRLPEDPIQNIIMIGPGTGLAPFRGFLQERQKQKENGIPIGKQLLFFGCRHPDQDFIYQTELEDYKRTGILQELFVAFSRLPDSPKHYVQDLLREKGPIVWEYVKNNARIFVCGEGKHMAPVVRKALVDVFEKEGKLSHDEAQKLFDEKQNSHFYVEDVWAG